MKQVCYCCFDGLASVLAVVLRLLSPIVGAMRRLWRLAKLRSTTCGHVPPTTQFDGPAGAQNRPMLDFGDYCRLGRGTYFETAGDGKITLGQHVWLNTGCVLVSYADIQIGDKSLIGEYVSIRDANHGIDTGLPIQDQPHDAKPIVIGEDVWVGRGSVILGGVTVGDGAVIGANSVVTKDVPAMAIMAGVPAKLIRMRGQKSMGDETQS